MELNSWAIAVGAVENSEMVLSPLLNTIRGDSQQLCTIETEGGTSWLGPRPISNITTTRRLEAWTRLVLSAQMKGNSANLLSRFK